jgi:hypothetical protein
MCQSCVFRAPSGCIVGLRRITNKMDDPRAQTIRRIFKCPKNRQSSQPFATVYCVIWDGVLQYEYLILLEILTQICRTGRGSGNFDL